MMQICKSRMPIHIHKPISEEDQAWLKEKLKKAKTERQKGNVVEELGRYILEKKGWLVWKPPRAKWTSQDIFGLFDMLAFHYIYDPMLIQFSLGKARKEHTEGIEGFAKFYNEYKKREWVYEYWILKLPKKKAPYWEIRRY